MKRLFAKLKDARERHRERHRPTGFQFALVDRIDFANPVHWDAVTASSSLFLQRRYLRILEQTGSDEFRSRYAIIYQGSEPVGAVVIQILSITGDRILAKKLAKKENILKRALVPAAHKVTSSMRQRVMVCGNLFSWGCHGVAFAPGFSMSQLWAPVAEAIYRVRRAERLSGQTHLVLVKDLPKSGLMEATPLKRFSYRPLTTDPDMVLMLKPEWKTYEDYLNSLDRKYRKSALQISKEIDAAGCKVGV